ncbi:hypothetical protein CPC08DRAFT_417939 [Agrocybe pediades]|nr:hypothetical protein CPC08DRAFT_417939 [Agrocybe pediades]
MIDHCSIHSCPCNMSGAQSCQLKALKDAVGLSGRLCWVPVDVVSALLFSFFLSSLLLRFFQFVLCFDMLPTSASSRTWLFCCLDYLSLPPLTDDHVSFDVDGMGEDAWMVKPKSIVVDANYPRHAESD